MENLTGQRIDRYEILELLGKGGMAMVYKAYDTRLERELAIKIIRRDAFPPEDLHDVTKRFEREAKSLARLSHPNIVKVMDYGEYEGSPFLVLEYFPGGTLKQKIGGPVAWQEAARLLLPIARGVEYAHNRGVIHRDIKPANILMTEDGEPTLSDFGIAKLFQGEKTTTLTGSGAAIGTPEYMAPEQWTGQTGPKSDMYSLGVILYEMVTGRRPYIADTPGGVFLKQVTEPLPLPGEIVPNLPESVERFLLKTLAKEPADRHADLGAFIKELESLLSIYDREAKEKAERDAQETRVGQVVKKPFETKPEPKKQRSTKFPLWGIGLIAIAFLALIVWGVSSISTLPEATQTPSTTQTLLI
jgi:serine/threonine protein kinase